MRSIIEVSAYVIIITIMCYLGIDYVRMNMQVMDMNEAVRYVENYIEINATMDNTYEIDQKTLSEVNAYMEKRGLIPEFVYEYWLIRYIFIAAALLAAIIIIYRALRKILNIRRIYYMPFGIWEAYFLM